MPKFFYKAKTQNKQLKEGILEAEHKIQVLRKLEELSYYPIVVREIDELKDETVSFVSRGKISSADIIYLTRQISNLVGAGLTILAALNIVQKQITKLSLKMLIREIAADLKDGVAFSDALSKHPKEFSNLYVSLIRSGEIGGFLDKALLQLADFLENEEEIKANIRSAMAYPILIAVAGVAAVFVLLSVVIPRLVLVFQDFEQALPRPTEILINISMFLNQYWWLIIVGLCTVIFIINRIAKTREGKLFFDRSALGIPLIGNIILKRQMERFCRTLATLLRNGVTILPSLKITKDVLENEILKLQIAKVYSEISDGTTLSNAMRKSSRFPISVVNMVSVGEESGMLEGVLNKVADSYEREINRHQKTLISLLEPMMILIMGSVVAFIVLAMLLPIFEMNFMVG